MSFRDFVRCKAPLPGNPPPGVGPDFAFMTADTDWLAMNEYEITADGAFVRTLQFFEDNEAREPLPDFHRDLHFYNGSPVDFGGGEKGYVEYCARFSDGKLSRLTLVKRQTEQEFKAECQTFQRQMQEADAERQKAKSQ